MSSSDKIVLGIKDKPKLTQWFLLSIQHLFAMFGATVLVPALTGMSPAVALVSSGLGTLAFIVVTRGKVPSYLGSSFAFINPIIATKAFDGFAGIMMGSFMVGLVYAIMALVIAKTGTKWLMKLLPPIVVGPVIMVIGLGLSSVAVSMVTNHDGGYDINYVLVGLVTLLITIIFAIFTRGFLSVVPVLMGIIGGYIFAVIMNIVDFQQVIDAPWFQVPPFEVPFIHFTPHFTWKVFLLMVPVAIVPIAEHIGHQLVLSKVVEKDLLADPGLDSSMLGDGVASVIASFIGGIYLFIGAAIFAILFGFCGKVAALLSSIPTPVMGGVSILLFGIIASSGLRMLVENKIDFSQKRNLIIASVILVIGIGGAAIHVGSHFSLEGMALASIIGIVLNQILPGKEVVDFKDMFGE
mgnify:CR=1 FL=1